MATQNVCWEDDENNRRVEMVVEYDFSDAELDVKCVTPNKITFLDPSTGAETRAIGVHTEAGRSMIVRQYLAWGGLQHLNAVLGGELVAAN